MPVEEAALRVSWTGDIDSDKELAGQVQEANRLLTQEIGTFRGVVAADWRICQDNLHRLVLELMLTDSFTQSQVIAKLAPEDFRDESRLGSLLHRLWGDLLQRRATAQIKRLEKLALQVEGE